MNQSFVFDGDVVKSGIVTVSHKVRENNAAEPVEMKTTLDFAGVKVDAIVGWAIETVIIRAAAKFRKFGDAWIKSHAEHTVKVVELFSGQRGGFVSQEKATLDFIGKLTPAQLAEFSANPQAFLEKWIASKK